jgi:hypothetical protein
MKYIVKKAAQFADLKTSQVFLLKLLFDWSDGLIDDDDLISFCQFYGIDNDYIFEDLKELTNKEYLKHRQTNEGESWKMTQKTITLFEQTSLLAAA